MCPSILGIVQAIQNCVMVAFLYVPIICAIQSQHYTMHIMLSVHVPGRVQSQDIIIVTSPFKTVHFQNFFKNNYDVNFQISRFPLTLTSTSRKKMKFNLSL